jgi:hypothetical protein
MAVDTSYQPGIYKEQGGNKLVVKTGASVEIYGSIAVQSGGSITGYLPTLPTGDGDYVLHVASGVLSWVAAS